jgi:hypothetical protein
VTNDLYFNRFHFYFFQSANFLVLPANIVRMWRWGGRGFCLGAEIKLEGGQALFGGFLHGRRCRVNWLKHHDRNVGHLLVIQVGWMTSGDEIPQLIIFISQRFAGQHRY